MRITTFKHFRQGASLFLFFCLSFTRIDAQTIAAYPFDYTDNAVEFKEQHPTTANNLSLLFDNDENTIYRVEGVSSTRITATLKYPIVLTGYAFANPNGSSANTDDWKVEYSTSGRVWYPLNIKGEKNKNNLKIFTLTNNPEKENAIAAKYYRITATGAGSVEIGEWQLFGVPYIDDKQQYPADITNEKSFIIPSSIGFDPIKNNVPYEYSYIFNIPIDLSKNTQKITLPANSNILIFSATLAEDDVNTIYSATELVDSSLEKKTESR